jgi:hypothetical protein
MMRWIAASAVAGVASAAWTPPPCAPVYSSGILAGEDNVLKPCASESQAQDGTASRDQPEFKAMGNGVCEAGWEPIPAQGAYGAEGAFEECARAARALKILPVGPFTNGSKPDVGGRDEKDLPAGCYFYELPVVGYSVFFGMQGSPTQTDGQRRVICKRRAPLAKDMCCAPNTELRLGHGDELPFGDDMVLQHGRPAAIFGLAKAGSTVTVVYDGKSYTAKANPDPFAPGWGAPLASNSWRVELDPQPAGPAKGNITVTCEGCAANASTAVLSSVLFGEVIICSGQSNMELPLLNTFSWHTDFEATDEWSTANGKQWISNDTSYPIRFLKLGHNVQLRENISFASPAPSWTVPSYNSLQDFSATCWYTGRAMHNLQPTDAKTPIGLIEASWGGTIIVSTAGFRLT